MKILRLTEEEIAVISQSLKAVEATFYHGCSPIQTALMKVALSGLLTKLNAGEPEPVKPVKKGGGRGRPRKPKSTEPLILNELHDPTESLLDYLRNDGLFPAKIFNPCAGTNQGTLTHFLGRRAEEFTLILNEEKERISIPIDSDFCPTLESEWQTWKDKEYLNDWVIFEPQIEEARLIMQLAISYSENVAVLLPVEYSNPRICPAELWDFLQERKPDSQILTEASVWLVWSLA